MDKLETANNPRSLFHKMPPEVNDQIYQQVGEGLVVCIKKNSTDPRTVLPQTVYDSLSLLDAHLNEEHVRCTLASNGPQEFFRRYRRKPNRRYKLPHHTRYSIKDTDMSQIKDGLDRVRQILPLSLLLPYRLQILAPIPIVDDVYAQIALVLGARYYETVESQTDLGMLNEWQTIMAISGWKQLNDLTDTPLGIQYRKSIFERRSI